MQAGHARDTCPLDESFYIFFATENFMSSIDKLLDQCCFLYSRCATAFYLSVLEMGSLGDGEGSRRGSELAELVLGLLGGA